MSDTTDTKTTNIEESQANTQQPDAQEASSDATPKASEETFSKEQVAEMLNKARQDEKSKLYKTIEKNKAEANKLVEDRDKVLGELNEAKDRLQLLQDANMSDIEKVNKQLELLAEQNKLLQAQVESVSKQAEERVRNSELSAYKQKQIESANLMFPEMVSGSTREEIDESIKMLKERESSVRQSLEEKLRAEQAVNVPRPMSPEGSTSTVSVKDRYQLSKLDRGEYAKVRQKLMSQALDSVNR